MNDKPVYKEFVRRTGDTVVTADGRSFLVENNGVLHGIKIGYTCLFCILIVLVKFIDFDFGKLPLNALFDVAAISLLLYWPLTQLLYRLARFREVNDSDENNCRIGIKKEPCYKKKIQSPNNHCALFAIFLAALLFCIANSVSVFYIRSMIEGSSHMNVLALEADGEPPDTWQNAYETVLYLPWAQKVHIEVETVCEPQPGQLTLSNDPMDVYDDYIVYDENISWFWEKDYLVRHYDIWLDQNDICDGTTVELYCGKIDYLWWIDLPGA